MSIVAMKVLRVASHLDADADALRVVRFGLSEGEPVVVVANLETTYELGDVVAVARVGATLNDDVLRLDFGDADALRASAEAIKGPLGERWAQQLARDMRLYTTGVLGSTASANYK